MKTFQERWGEHCRQFNIACYYFAVAENWKERGRTELKLKAEQDCWHSLFLAEEALCRKQPTARQKEAQRLWQQRGLLERTLANMRAVSRDGSIKLHRAKEFVAAIDELYEQIRHNKRLMSTISHRISKTV